MILEQFDANQMADWLHDQLTGEPGGLSNAPSFELEGFDATCRRRGKTLTIHVGDGDNSRTFRVQVEEVK
jgi:hypothetical protein